MPGEDKKGPQGEGPRTGRGLGRCRPNKTQTDRSVNQRDTPPERGFGKGRRQGLGAGRRSSRGSGSGRGRGAGRG